MARIRTIKPEFPQSESMGKISRDARLLFIQLWTLVDDSGRTRGNSRMLASLLYPYDDDAPALIGTWIAELEQEGCIILYTAEGQTYLEVCNFRQHQKIDRPTASKLPAPGESSRILASPRENLLRIKDQGRDQGEYQGGEKNAQAREENLPPQEKNFPSFRNPHGVPNNQIRIAELIETWNQAGLPECRNTITATWPRSGEIANNLQTWQQPDIIGAIKNYSQANAEPQDFQPGILHWSTLPSFLAGKGIENWWPGAKPLERFAKATKPVTDDRKAIDALLSGRPT